MKLIVRASLLPVCLLACVSTWGQGTAKHTGKKVMLDYYFNNEYKKDAAGNMNRFHYTWEDKAMSGYSIWGDIFRSSGAETLSLETAPTTENLKQADVYIIVDADTEKETAKPNYIQPADIKAITAWVKAGGVLLLMANDSGNAEFTHFNHLATKFGIRFKEDRYNLVFNNQYEQGALVVPEKHPILATSKKVFIKELSTLALTKPAKAVFTDKGHVIMAVAKYGKGTVLAIGDPWVYNEYIDGKRLPAQFENPQAAADLANWLLNQVPKKKKK